jgi:hypothetical protein
VVVLPEPAAGEVADDFFITSGSQCVRDRARRAAAGALTCGLSVADAGCLAVLSMPGLRRQASRFFTVLIACRSQDPMAPRQVYGESGNL